MATREPLGDVSLSEPGDVAEAVARGREARILWGGLTLRQRTRILLDVREAILDHRDELAETLARETGKPVVEAMAAELFGICEHIEYWARKAPRVLAERRVSTGFLKNRQAWSTLRPVGVVGIIAPWNFPLILSVGEAFPALLAGNAVIIKPSEVAPLAVTRAVELANTAGLPEGILQVVNGGGETGAELVEAADMIAFTGSVETGRRIGIRCAELMKPCSLELGGNDPVIVSRDADLARAAAGCTWAAMTNAGQMCVSAERVYVHERAHDRFLAALEKEVRALRVGPNIRDSSAQDYGAQNSGEQDSDVQGSGVQGSASEEPDVACMTTEAQTLKIERHIVDAVERGARIVCGGQRQDNHPMVFEPTILADVDESMAVMSEETFGPVIAVRKVRDDAEALALANDSRFGLSASIWSRDRRGACNMARHLEAGTVCVNDHAVHVMMPDAPMGGVKDSGNGRRYGEEGLRRFCHQQTIVVERFGFRRDPVWYPRSSWVARLLPRWMDLRFRRTLQGKLTGRNGRRKNP